MNKRVQVSPVSIMFKVFVYGTLKKGEPNHHWLQDSKNGTSNFAGKGQTRIKYPLIIATRYNIPFLLDASGQGFSVRGEVYEVDEKMLANLDILEDHPSLYVRRLEEISVGSEIERCWTYFLPKFKPEFLQKKMLTSYSNNGPDCPVYCESDDEADLTEELCG